MADKETSNIVDLIDYRNKKSWLEGAMQGLERQFAHSQAIAQEFYDLLATNHVEAVRQLNRFIDRAREHSHNAKAMEAYSGGPCEYVTAPFLNAVGAIYAGIDREARESALRQCLAFLDLQNTMVCQQNLQLIDEPWLVGDIIFNRYPYACGYDIYKPALKEARTWKEFLPIMEKAGSKFWLAYAVTKPEYTSLDIRTKFHKNFPNLSDRTLDVIAAWTFKFAFLRNYVDGTPYDAALQGLLNRYDTLLHDRVREKIEEMNWISLSGGRDEGDLALKLRWGNH